MVKWLLGLALAGAGVLGTARLAAAFEEDVFKTSKGDLKVACLGHSSLMLAWNGKIIHVDPVGQYADYGGLPKADLILITHDHYDHLDPAAIAKVKKAGTEIVATKRVAGKLAGAIALENGGRRTVQGIGIEAAAAYNIVHMRGPGSPYHPKGDGNGYVVTLADNRVYIAGDTENTPEMKALKDIDIAFLPMNLPFTMTPEMVADAAKAFKPKVLYPYHYGETDPQKLTDLLKGEKGIEVRIRNLR